MSKRPDQRPMRALPVLEAQRVELETCAYCPKLCRSACPVSNAEPRETLTPWGKMTTAYVTALGDAPMSTEMAAPAWACTGCRACSHACDHDNDVANTLLAARSATLDRGMAPAAAMRVVTGFAAHCRSTRIAAEELESSASSRTALLVGCGYVRRAKPEAHDACSAARALLGPVRVVADCCGLPLLLAGDRSGFDVHARRLALRLADADRVVVVDPGCAVALRKQYPSDITLPPVSLLVEEAASRVDSLSVGKRESNVRWHDPCQLGRGLGIYDAPRSVLTRILGHAPLEQQDSRERGRCSGAGGLLPLTMPETSKVIATERTDEHERLGSGELVTACASSLLSLRKAAQNRFPVSDLSTWIARATK